MVAIQHTDADGVFDYLDLVSDNDGIYDLVESNSSAIDLNRNGIVDGTQLVLEITFSWR